MDVALVICLVCQNDEAERPQVCDHDRARIVGTLRDLGPAYAALFADAESPTILGLLVIDDGDFDSPRVETVYGVPGGPTKAASGGATVSGSRDAPVPVNLDLIDLTAPARLGMVRDTRVPLDPARLAVHEPAEMFTVECELPGGTVLERVPLRPADSRALMLPAGDQIGELSVASVLDSWVRDWIDVRGQREHAPAANVLTMVDWLGKRVDWACDRHPAVDEFADEIHRLLWACRRLAGELEPQPERCHGVPCSRCDQLDLWRHPGSKWRAICGTCGRIYDEDDYERWVGSMAAYSKATRGRVGA